MTVDGFGFGTDTEESCLKNVHCHTDRASWDAILVTVVAFGALNAEKVCTVTQIRLGEGGVKWGGGDTIGGGGGGRRTENWDHICMYTYTYIHISIYTRIHVYICTYIRIYIYKFYTYIHIYICTYVHKYIHT